MADHKIAACSIDELWLKGTVDNLMFQVKVCDEASAGFACCLWVMSGYQEWAKDPILSHYLFPLLALLLAMVACYLISAFAFGKGRVTATLFFAAAAAAAGIMVLADGEALYAVSLRLGIVLYLLAMAGTLAENASRPAPPTVLPAGCAPADCAACPGCPPAGPEPKPIPLEI